MCVCVCVYVCACVCLRVCVSVYVCVCVFEKSGRFLVFGGPPFVPEYCVATFTLKRFRCYGFEFGRPLLFQDHNDRKRERERVCV